MGLDKDREIAQLRAELDAAKEQIRKMQRQILASKANDLEFLTIRDEDYFDNACQQLCQHVQQWVLRFSKFSDMRACRLTSEINNDKTIGRLDNAILDGSDVDSYLADRVKRRDVFMSMTMTMVWEFIFTRYLFGMDREQRQKLGRLKRRFPKLDLQRQSTNGVRPHSLYWPNVKLSARNENKTPRRSCTQSSRPCQRSSPHRAISRHKSKSN